MILDKIVIISVAILFITLLCVRYVRRYAPENLIIVALAALGVSSYITFAVMNMSIHLYAQIVIFIFSFVVPAFTIMLQYNNIILKRKIRYIKMKNAYKNREYERAIKLIEKIVLDEGRKSEYLYILGQCYKELRDFINARDSFALSAELDPKAYKSYYELGLILDETNKKETAMVMFNKALKIKPDYYEAAEALGICLTSQGRFEEAVKAYKDAVKIHENSCELYYNIGMLEMEIGHFDDAEKMFTRSGQINPNLYTAFYNLGEINYIKGDYDKAIEEYKKIVKSSIYGPKAYYKIAMAYAAKSEYDLSMSALEYVIEFDPKYLKMAKDEFIFRNMLDRIDEYVKNKEELERLKREKKNYMRDRLRLFKRKREETEDEEVEAEGSQSFKEKVQIS